MSEAVLYLSDCVDEALMKGSTTIPESAVDYLIEAVNSLKWNNVDDVLPENLSVNKGKKMIACLVATEPPKSQPGRKPHVTVAQRQLVGGFRSPERWEWSRGLKVIKWRPVPEVD